MESPRLKDTTQTEPIQIRAKRRKVRRGTSGCWECKRRKVRCDWESTSATVCSACSRRGAQCVPQYVSEGTAEGGNHREVSLRYQDVAESIGRVETLVHGLVQARPGHQFPSPASNGPSGPTGKEVSRRYRTLRSAGLARNNQLHDVTREQWFLGSPPAAAEPLGRLIHSFLPPPHVAAVIMRCETYITLSLGRAKDPYARLTPSPLQQPDSPNYNMDLPLPTASPATLAAKLLQLALCLQQMHPQLDLSPLQLGSRSVRDVADHYFSAAVRLVLRDAPGSTDENVVSLDGLGALMLETMYHINAGCWYAGWMASQRAVTVARRMGLDRLVSGGSGASSLEGYERERANQLWLRLTYGNRLLSVVLGRPPGDIADDSFASKHHLDTDVLQGGLDRMHARIMGRVAKRNEKMSCGTIGHREVTQQLDLDLKRVTKALPSQWWLQPAPSDTATDTTLLENLSRLLSQIHHHHLVLLTHLPYITSPTLQAPQEDQHPESLTDYTYSTLTAAYAAHEILSRFLAARQFGHTPLCSRGFEAKAVSAALTLLLAHIEGHGRGDEDNVLAHRRLGDVDMVARAVAHMESIAVSWDDGMNRANAVVLRRLLAVEEEAAQGEARYGVVWSPVRSAAEWDLKQSTVLSGEGEGLKLAVPYFGSINIGRMTAPDAE